MVFPPVSCATTGHNGGIQFPTPGLTNTDLFFSVVNSRNLDGEHAVLAGKDTHYAFYVKADSDGKPIPPKNPQDFTRIVGGTGCPSPTTMASTASAAATLQSEQKQKTYLVTLVGGGGPNSYRVETRGGRTIITSQLFDRSLWMIEVATREYKLKVGETVRLASLPEKTAERHEEKLRNPRLRSNSKPEVVEAKVIQPEGSAFGEIEFTAKAEGEARLEIDYEFYSHTVGVFLGLARILVNVKVEQ